MGVVVVVMELTLAQHLTDGCILDHLNNRLPDFKFLQTHMQKQTYAADSENSRKNVIFSTNTITPLAESGLQTW
jgi:hypothetical protein